MAQVRPITSEALEAQIRDLLPSQNGFTEDLQASNVITPIIDLSSAAGGSSTPEFLQRAWDFSTGHTFLSGTSSSTIVNTTGFWQVDVTSSLRTNGDKAKLEISDGTTRKIIWEFDSVASGAGTSPGGEVTDGQFVAFLRAGDSLIASLSGANCAFNLWYRQIADVNGKLVDPQGFTPQ